MVDGGLLALKEFGTRPFAEAIQPALDLADEMPLDEIRARAITRASRFFPALSNVAPSLSADREPSATGGNVPSARPGENDSLDDRS